MRLAVIDESRNRVSKVEATLDMRQNQSPTLPLFRTLGMILRISAAKSPSRELYAAEPALWKETADTSSFHLLGA